MDNRLKLILILALIVIVAGVSFDASHRLKKLEEKGAVSSVEKNSEEQTSSLHQDEIANPDLEQAQEASEDTIKSEFELMAQAAKEQVRMRKKNISSDEDMFEDDIEVPTGNLPSLQDAQKNDSFKEEQKESSKHDVAKSGSRIFIGPLQYDSVIEDIPVSMKTSDSMKNEYYFIAPESLQMSNSLGLLVKISPRKKILWSKEIIGSYAQKPTVSSIKLKGSNLYINLSTSPSRPLVLTSSGGYVSGPAKFSSYSKVQRPSNAYKFKLLNSFNFNNEKFLIADFIELVPSTPNKLPAEYFYLYKFRDGKYYKHTFITQYMYNKTAKPAQLTVQNEGSGVLIIVIGPKNSDAKRISAADLKSNAYITGGEAPIHFTEGLNIQNAPYLVEYFDK